MSSRHFITIVFAKHSPLTNVAFQPEGRESLDGPTPMSRVQLLHYRISPSGEPPLTSSPPGLPNQRVLESRQCSPRTLGPAKSSSSSSMSTASSPTESSSY